MRLRAVFLDVVMIPLWAFVCFLYLSLVGLDIPLLGLGVIFGLICGAGVALKYIGSIEKKGEYRVTLRTWAIFDRAHVREKHPEYFHEVRKWQRAYILSWTSVVAFMALTFLNNVVYSNSFLGLLFSTGTVIVASLGFFTLLKLRSVAKKYGVPWRKTLPLYGIYSVAEAQKVVTRAAARATGRSEKEIEEKMKNHTAQD